MEKGRARGTVALVKNYVIFLWYLLIIFEETIRKIVLNKTSMLTDPSKDALMY